MQMRSVGEFSVRGPYANEMLMRSTEQLLDGSWRYWGVFMQMRCKLGLQAGSLEGVFGGGN